MVVLMSPTSTPTTRAWDVPQPLQRRELEAGNKQKRPPLPPFSFSHGVAVAAKSASYLRRGLRPRSRRERPEADRAQSDMRGLPPNVDGAGRLQRRRRD